MRFWPTAVPAPRGQVAAAIAAAALVGALLPASASAAGTELSAIAGAYAQHGAVPPCQFSSDQLSTALSEAGGDIQQYGADLLAAIQAALSARAAGACDRRAGAVVTTTTTTAVTTTTARSPGGRGTPAHVRTVSPPPAPPSSAPAIAPAQVPVVPVAAPTRGPVPAPLWLIAIAVALAALGGTVGALWAARGWDPLWLAGARHAVAEAAHRLSGVAADIGDWSRGAR